MANYQADAKAFLQHIGGKENIRAVSHCMTRMRFVLMDPVKAEPGKIEALPGSGPHDRGSLLFAGSRRGHRSHHRGPHRLENR